MKCPRCGLNVNDAVPRCQGCGFTIADLERQVRQAPERHGYVNDFSGKLPADAVAPLEERLHRFHLENGGEIVVAVVPRTKPLKPSEYVFWLFNRWQIGGDTHTGILLLLALEERRIECEVGYSWEPIISDAESGRVLDEQVVPLLKQGTLATALSAGAAALAEIIAAGLPSAKLQPQEGEGA